MADMDFLNPIFTEKAECQDCYKCVRECSVKAIKVEGGRAAIVPELCVLCGHCVQVCPSGAKRVRDDLPRARRLVQAGGKTIAALAPSFVSQYPGLEPGKLVAALRALGFSEVSETALGADLVSRRLASELRRAKPGTIIISSACPSVVQRIKKYHPSLASAVSDVYSPLLAQAALLKQRLGRDCGIVFIGPCISKKKEADLHAELVDVAIDFMDLDAWFSMAGIDPWSMKPGPEDRFFPERAAAGTLYPIDGGMTESIRNHERLPKTRWMSFSGIKAIDKALAGLSAANTHELVFLEMLACSGGCVHGPRCERQGGTVVKRLLVQEYAQTAADIAAQAVAQTAAVTDGVEREGIETPDISCVWPIEPVSIPEPEAADMEAALRATGKNSRSDELDCGGCGYDSCRDFARAMIEKRAESSMCVSYTRRLAQKKANGLFRAIPNGVVIADRELKVVECNRAFASLLGPDIETLWDTKPGMEGADLTRLVPFHGFFSEVMKSGVAIERDLRLDARMLHGTIFGIERGAFAGGVFQDLTSPWIRKDRVVSQARKVIQKNLAVVQKIAFLLGENAAESEAILSSIIDSFDEQRKVETDRGANDGRDEP